jgi:peptidoglycan/LPS O-acetylase OafA/YrhL
VPYFLSASNIIRDLGLPTGIVQQLDVSHLWSLAVEEQFYLVWPLVVWWARSRRRIIATCIAGSAVSVVLRLLAAGNTHFFLGTPYFELPMRLDSLLFGGALAMLVRSPRAQASLTPARLFALATVGFFALLLSFAQARHGSMFSPPLVRYGYLAASVTFAAVVGLAVRPGTWVSRLGETSALRALGRCSYGLYLIHLVPVYWYREALAFVQDFGHTEWQREALGSVVFLVYFVICFGVATLSYNTLESFFLRRKRSFQYADEAARQRDESKVSPSAGPVLRA